MEKFIEAELRLKKDIKKGDEETLLSLFSTAERFKQMEVLKNSEEDSIVKVILDDLGEIDLKLGADMERGRKKTIMTYLFKPENIKIDMWCR